MRVKGGERKKVLYQEKDEMKKSSREEKKI